MKSIVIAALLFATLVACNSGDSGKDAPAEKKEEKKAETPVTENPDYAAGLALVGQSGCLTCHKIGEKLIGPSYEEVANKYASQAPGIIPTLAEKIIKGGSGVWGEVPMQAHPTIAQADAETMVKYILLLKTN